MSSGEHANVGCLRALYDAYATRDFEALRAVFTEDFVWHVSGPSQFAGDKQGFEAFADYLAELGRTTGGTMQVSPYQFFANENHGVALVVVSRERHGRALVNRAANVVEFDGGLIRQAWFLDEDPTEIEEFYNR